MLLASTVFFLACVGILALFALKHWERAHARVLFPRIRRSADDQALWLKARMVASARDLEKLPPYILYVLEIGVHMGATTFGHLAHWIGERSHDLADFVSHKHRFERREPKSEYLKQVNLHPIRSRNGSNGTSSIDVLLEDKIVPLGAKQNEASPVEENLAKKSSSHAKSKKRKVKRKNGINGEDASLSV